MKYDLKGNKTADFNESLKRLKFWKSDCATGNKFHTGSILPQNVLYHALVLQVSRYNIRQTQACK